MTILDTLHTQYENAKRRRWDRMYWAIDLHSTLILPTYDQMTAADVRYYPHADDVMRVLSQRPDARLILYTCSWPAEIQEYQRRFVADGIRFDWVSENPEVGQTEYGDYSKKPYFNLLLDDKAGFDAGSDWLALRRALERLPDLASWLGAETGA